MATLKTRAWRSLAALAAVMGLVLFLSAGTLRYWNAWGYLVLFFGLASAMTQDMVRRDPALLARRVRGGPGAEPRPLQRLLMLGASLGFVALMVVPALDFRFKWSTVPLGGVLLGAALFVLGFGLIGRVYRENTYGAATVEVMPGQRVIDTGPYAVVRHPMYAGGLVYLVGTPLALGSYYGLLAVAFALPFLIGRLLDEERVLTRDLPGYSEYRCRVRHRLVPFLW